MKQNFSITITALIFFVVHTFFRVSNIHDILSLLLTLILGFILLYLSFCLKIKKRIFPSFINTFLLVIFFLIIISTSILFIHEHYLNHNNYFISISTLLFLVLIIGKNKLSVIASLSNILLFFFVITFCLLIYGSFNYVTTNNFSLSPMFSLLPFGIILITYHFKDKKRDVYKGYYLASIALLIEVLITILSSGHLLSNTYLFTHVSVLKSVSSLSFLGSIEILFSFSYLYGHIITLALIIYLIKKEFYDSNLQTKPNNS